MSHKKARSVFALMAVVSLLLPLLSACKSAELQAIEDATSVLQLTKGREVERFLQDGGKAMGKPVYPEILIVYEPLSNYTQEEVYAEIVTILKNNNWVGSEPNTGRRYFEASLQQGKFNISTGVAIDKRNNHATVTMTVYP